MKVNRFILHSFHTHNTRKKMRWIDGSQPNRNHLTIKNFFEMHTIWNVFFTSNVIILLHIFKAKGFCGIFFRLETLKRKYQKWLSLLLLIVGFWLQGIKICFERIKISLVKFFFLSSIKALIVVIYSEIEFIDGGSFGLMWIAVCVCVFISDWLFYSGIGESKYIIVVIIFSYCLPRCDRERKKKLTNKTDFYSVALNNLFVCVFDYSRAIM